MSEETITATATTDLTRRDAERIADLLYHGPADDPRGYVSGFAERHDDGEYQVGARRFSGGHVHGFGKDWRSAIEMMLKNESARGNGMAKTVAILLQLSPADQSRWLQEAVGNWLTATEAEAIATALQLPPLPHPLQLAAERAEAMGEQ